MRLGMEGTIGQGMAIQLALFISGRGFQSSKIGV